MLMGGKYNSGQDPLFSSPFPRSPGRALGLLLKGFFTSTERFELGRCPVWLGPLPLAPI